MPTSHFFRGYFGLSSDPLPALDSPNIRFLPQQNGEDKAAAQARYRATPDGYPLLLPSQVELGYIRITGVAGSAAQGDTLVLAYQTNLNEAGNSVQWCRLAEDGSVIDLGVSTTLQVSVTGETRRYVVRRKSASGLLLVASEPVAIVASDAPSGGGGTPSGGGQATPNYSGGSPDSTSGFSADDDGQGVNEEKAPVLN